MRLKFTLAGLLVKLANHYTTQGVQCLYFVEFLLVQLMYIKDKIGQFHECNLHI